MSNKINNFLLTLLWLSAMTLATTFWCNTYFNFNIFSAQHWQYLAYLQASNAHVSKDLYLSFGAAIFVTILGLYILLTPRFHKTPVKDSKQTLHVPTASGQPLTPPQSPHDNTYSAQTAPEISYSTPKRPPRLNLPTQKTTVSTHMFPTAKLNSSIQTVAKQSLQQPQYDVSEICEIFKSADYVVNSKDFLGGLKSVVLAIGTNEQLWIGTIGITPNELRNVIGRMNDIFTTTLDDVTINVNGFIIDATNTQSEQNENILLFDSVAKLREYIEKHKNRKPANLDEEETFDAYVKYINTVIGFIGK